MNDQIILSAAAIDGMESTVSFIAERPAWTVARWNSRPAFFADGISSIPW